MFEEHLRILLFCEHVAINDLHEELNIILVLLEIGWEVVSYVILPELQPVVAESYSNPVESSL